MGCTIMWQVDDLKISHVEKSHGGHYCRSKQQIRKIKPSHHTWKSVGIPQHDAGLYNNGQSESMYLQIHRQSAK